MDPAPAARDPLGAVVAYNRRFAGQGRDPAWLRLKLDRLCASPFGFLRGTFHLFVADWATFGDDPLGPGAAQPIVGDLHLENFGAFRSAADPAVFDVNDFDEAGPGTPALDLARLCTSIVLADDRHGDARAVARIGSFVDAWVAAVRSPDLREAHDDEAPPVVRALLAEADDASRAAWLERRVKGEAGARRFKASDKYQPVADPVLRAAIAAGVQGFAAGCRDKPDVPGWPRVLDVATRIAGTGSLGRFRWAVLIDGKHGKPGKEHILELKESLPSLLVVAGNATVRGEEAGDDPAAQVIATQRRLQGAPPAWLGTAAVDGRTFTVRELQPTEAKLDVTSLSPSELDALCGACGAVLARLHLRGSAELPARADGRDRALRRRLAAFALRYADVVAADHEQLRAHREEVERALGLA